MEWLAAQSNLIKSEYKILHFLFFLHVHVYGVNEVKHVVVIQKLSNAPVCRMCMSNVILHHKKAVLFMPFSCLKRNISSRLR